MILAETEFEYRDRLTKESSEVSTPEDLQKFVQGLLDSPSDYSSCVYKVAAAGNAAAQLMASKLGITGFQASMVFWELNRMGGWIPTPGPARLVDYENLMYPQYRSKFNSITPSTWKWIQEQVKDKLKEFREGEITAVDSVIIHWKQIEAGNVPFGLVVQDR